MNTSPRRKLTMVTTGTLGRRCTVFVQAEYVTVNGKEKAIVPGDVFKDIPVRIPIGQTVIHYRS